MIATYENAETEFIRLVEADERAWNNEDYKGISSVESIITTPVVVFWRSYHRCEEKYTITVYETLDDVELYVTKLLFRAAINPLTSILSRLYVSKRLMHVRDVRIQFGAEPEKAYK